ncbi:MAG: hypothetical protein HQL06_12995 [Nitrospirae bacterium]|nr:hypothetical protein [Nitrospirota bacterium]
MIDKLEKEAISIVNPICCGIDVHKEKLSVCLNIGGEDKIREFGPFTPDLMDLRDWLIGYNCPIAAMESTGIYWRPVHIYP